MSQLPEGRKPLLWKDMPFAERPKAHPSSWEGEAKISRITISRLEARVAELEARIAKADALAEVAERAIRLSQEHDNFKLYAMEPMWQALAAYREGSDT